MKFRVSFRNMKASDFLKTYATKKIDERIRKFVTKPIDAHIVFEVDGSSKIATCQLHGGDGFNIHVEHQGEDMPSCVDFMVDKLSVQLKRQKDKLKSHKGKLKLGEVVSAEMAAASVDEEAEPSIDAEEVIRFEKARRLRALAS